MEDGGLSLPDGCSEGVGGNEGEIEGLSEGMRVGTHDGAYEGCNEGAGDDGAGVAQAASKSERHRESCGLAKGERRTGSGEFHFVPDGRIARARHLFDLVGRKFSSV